MFNVPMGTNNQTPNITVYELQREKRALLHYDVQIMTYHLQTGTDRFTEQRKTLTSEFLNKGKGFLHLDRPKLVLHSNSIDIQKNLEQP